MDTRKLFPIFGYTKTQKQHAMAQGYKYTDVQMTPGYLAMMYNTMVNDGFAIPFKLENATRAELEELRRQYNECY